MKVKSQNLPNYKATTPKEQIKSIKNYYIDSSKKIEARAQKFKSSINIYNQKTREKINIVHNPIKDAQDSYLWFVFNSMIMQEEFASNNDYVAIFLTLTLPSSYHRFMTFNNKKNDKQSYKFNPKFNKDNTIQKGAKLLNEAFRAIYANFKVKRKYEKTSYLKAFEPHKSHTTHLHSVLYVKRIYKDKFINHIKNTIGRLELGRYDIVEIEDIKKSSAYILKYINKTNNPQSEEQFHYFNGWKKMNKIRVFTHSITKLPRYIFKKVNSILKFSKDLKDKNPISEVLLNCDISVAIKNVLNKEKSSFKKLGTPGARYRIEIKKDYLSFEYSIQGLKNEDFIVKSENGFTISKNIFELYSKSTIKKFIITDTETENVIYDKSDFVLKDRFNFIECIERMKSDLVA
jgi:hypothetical protein